MATDFSQIRAAFEALTKIETALAAAKASKQATQANLAALNTEINDLQTQHQAAKAAIKSLISDF